MAKKKKVKKKAKRFFTFVMFSIIIITMLSITFGKVILDIIDKYKEKQELEDKLIGLQEEKTELENNIKKLEDPEYLARYAREKYFYSKEDEYILIIPEE